MKNTSLALHVPRLHIFYGLLALLMLLMTAFPAYAQNVPSRIDAIRITDEIYTSMLNGKPANIESNIASLNAYVNSKYGAQASTTDEGEALAEMNAFLAGTPIPGAGTSTATTTIVDFLQNVNSLYKDLTDEEYPEDKVTVDRIRAELRYTNRRMQLDVLEGALSRAESNGAEEIYDIWEGIEPEMKDNEAKQTMVTIVNDLRGGFERGDSAGIFAIGEKLESHIDPLMTQLDADQKQAKRNKMIIGVVAIIAVLIVAYAVYRRRRGSNMQY